MLKRIFKINIILCLLFLFSGCIYLRLLELKNQLKDFEKNYKILANNGFELTFINPLLLKKDIKKIMKSQAKSIDNKQWEYILKKDGTDNNDDFNIKLYFKFTDKRLTKFIFFKKSPRIFTKEFSNYFLTSIGYSDFDKKEMKFEVDFEKSKKISKYKLPGISEYLILLGEPNKIKINNKKIHYFYRYNLIGKKKTKIYILLDLYFDEKSKKIASYKVDINSYKILYLY